jgi:Protein kinase domain
VLTRIHTISPTSLDFGYCNKLLSRLHHPNIVRILGHAESETKSCLVMEYAAGGSLHTILVTPAQRKKLTPSLRLYVAETLVAALEYLHAKKVFHCDVKPGNICFWDDWENNPKMVLIDFGIASRVAETESGATRTSCPGTFPYMAGELLDSSFTEKCEVFSVGVVLVNLLLGGCSPDHRKASADRISSHLDGIAGKWSEDTGKAMASLSCQCRNEDPEKRPSVAELLKALKAIRTAESAEDLLDAADKERIDSYNERFLPTHTPKQVELLRCVWCGLERSQGVKCATGHLVCSSGSCLEEMVREKLAESIFICPSPKCLNQFQPIHFYGKIGADLYLRVLEAMDRAETIKLAIAEVNERIAKAECNIKEEIRKSAIDIIGANVATVRDNNLTLQIIESNITALVAAANEHEQTLEGLQKNLQQLVEKNNQEQQVPEDSYGEILKQIESLTLCQAKGISLLASGRLQCPRLFLLWPVLSRPGLRNRFTIVSEYQLVFLCAHDKSPVQTSVTISEPKKWLKKAAPLIKFALFSLKVLTIVCRIPLPSLPECVIGSDMSKRMDQVFKEMENLLEPDDIRSLDEWFARVEEQGQLFEVLEQRAQSINEKVYGSLVEEAYKPKNQGWIEEMKIGHRGRGEFAWVKKDNLPAWEKSVP